ncbi:MAG: hypothetical protein WBQ31_09080, partial [Candidatus Acidiferrales bacterium]
GGGLHRVSVSRLVRGESGEASLASQQAAASRRTPRLHRGGGRGCAGDAGGCNIVMVAVTAAVVVAVRVELWLSRDRLWLEK